MLTILRQRINKKKLSIIEKNSRARPNLLYFGYGANIDPDFFAKRFNNYEVLGLATLENYTFLINTPCEYRFKGFGGIEIKEYGQVFGTLYKINRDSLNLLDCLEWVPFNFYKRESLPVKFANRTLLAEVYIPLHPKNNLHASPEYLNLLIDGAKKMNFPDEYARYLKSFETRSKFELDHEFNLNNPGVNRLFSSTYYKHLDVLREKLSKII